MPLDVNEPISEKVSLTHDNPSAVLEFIGDDFEDAVVWAQDQLGGWRFSGTWAYYEPANYTRGYLYLYCVAADVDLLTLDSTGTEWKRPRVTLTFGLLDRPTGTDGEPESEELGDISYSLSGREMVVPKEQFQYVMRDDPDSFDETTTPDPGDCEPTDNATDDMVIEIPMADCTVSLKSQPTLDASVWAPYVGKINNDVFRGHAIGTVKFTGCKTDRTISSDGHSTFNHSYSFGINFAGWNKTYDSTNEQWVVTEPKRYRYADFNELFGG